MRSLRRSLALVAVACVLFVAACGDDDENDDAAASDQAEDTSSNVPDETTEDAESDDEERSREVPDVDPCSLASDTITEMFRQVMGQEPTVESSPDSSGRPQCTRSGAGSSLEISVSLSRYDDHFFDDSNLQTYEATPVSGLGDEAYMIETFSRATLAWRRDGFSVRLNGVPVDQIVALAQEIDSQMPAS